MDWPSRDIASTAWCASCCGDNQGCCPLASGARITWGGATGSAFRRCLREPVQNPCAALQAIQATLAASSSGASAPCWKARARAPTRAWLSRASCLVPCCTWAGFQKASVARNVSSTLLIVDAQMVKVKNSDAAAQKAMTRARKVSGGHIKPHIAVDSQGLPYAIAVTPVACLQGHAQSLDRRAHPCLAGEELARVEKLRAAARTSVQFIHLAFLVLLLRRL